MLHIYLKKKMRSQEAERSGRPIGSFLLTELASSVSATNTDAHHSATSSPHHFSSSPSDKAADISYRRRSQVSPSDRRIYFNTQKMRQSHDFLFLSIHYSSSFTNLICYFFCFRKCSSAKLHFCFKYPKTLICQRKKEIRIVA